MELINQIHASAEHVLYLLAGLSILFPLVDFLRKKPVSKTSMWVVRAYIITATLQLALGVTQLAVRWSDLGDGLRYRLEHAAIMIVAVVCLHFAPRFMKRRDYVGSRTTMFLMIASLALIILGSTLIKSALRG